MATNKEIKDVLGLRSSASGRQVENAAIRAFCVGGDDLLDGIEKVNRLAVRLSERQLAGYRVAQQSLDSLRELRDIMLEVIRKRDINSQRVDNRT